MRCTRYEFPCSCVIMKFALFSEVLPCSPKKAIRETVQNVYRIQGYLSRAAIRSFSRLIARSCINLHQSRYDLNRRRFSCMHKGCWRPISPRPCRKHIALCKYGDEAPPPNPSPFIVNGEGEPWIEITAIHPSFSLCKWYCASADFVAFRRECIRWLASVARIPVRARRG